MLSHRSATAAPSASQSTARPDPESRRSPSTRRRQRWRVGPDKPGFSLCRTIQFRAQATQPLGGATPLGTRNKPRARVCFACSKGSIVDHQTRKEKSRQTWAVLLCAEEKKPSPSHLSPTMPRITVVAATAMLMMGSAPNLHGRWLGVMLCVPRVFMDSRRQTVVCAAAR